MSRVSPGLLLVHKPVGVTSASLVEALRGELAATPGKLHKVCHGGALDPFAEGLLLLLLGPATKLFERLHEVPKAYEATVRWGVETDTVDLNGRPTAEGDARALTPALLEAALEGFRGWQAQVPPATSNKRVGGERAYVKAHRGEAFELPPSNVYLHEARWLAHELPTRSRLEVVVRGGFYVRSLARDLGRAVGARAHLEALRRVRIGPWPAPAPGQRVHIEGAGVVPWLERVELSDDEWGRVKAGAASVDVRARPRRADWALPAGFPAPAPWLVGLHQRRVVALFERASEGLAPVQVLWPPL
ncbi:MAG: tRNA pseudouridine(55) synthase TruB [Myxococcaceae bacterium]|jgi:tRNA pseudouridine55 synthase|nr:tRNA pseudouridine(55) synthase TruB [Myxococcaceae bacterium]MCA3011757.1 tRNA pseudouridine(55) synthase TruB [Myxococcaceae bacterium]